MNNLPEHYVYQPGVIDFVTVAAETCLFFEKATHYSIVDFVDKSTKLLPLLYLKTVMLSQPEREDDGFAERFVNEADYNFVNEQLRTVLGVDDDFLEVFHPDMALSDTPIAASIAENLADVYQELKDMAGNYQTGDTGVMNDALADCLEAFRAHWGQKLLNALRALHALLVRDDLGEERDVEKTNENTLMDNQPHERRNNMFDYNRNE